MLYEYRILRYTKTLGRENLTRKSYLKKSAMPSSFHSILFTSLKIWFVATCLARDKWKFSNIPTEFISLSLIYLYTCRVFMNICMMYIIINLFLLFFVYETLANDTLTANFYNRQTDKVIWRGRFALKIKNSVIYVQFCKYE